jgi:hypothetical protein
VSSLHPGEDIVLSVTGATPGELVRFGAGTPGPGPCLDAQHCLQIRPRAVLGSAVANAAGEALLIADSLPATLVDLPIGFQAGVPGAAPTISQRVMRFMGVDYATIDASAGTVGPGAPDPQAWVYFSFDAGLVTPTNPSADHAWDLKLQRTWYGMNGGASGPGNTEATVAADSWSDISEADASWSFVSDQPDADADGLDELVMQDWYEYDFRTHTLSSWNDVYLIHTDDDRYLKMQIVDYYSVLGVSGHPTLRWAWIAGVERTAMIDASAGTPGPNPQAGDWIYVSLASGEQVDQDGLWDIALQRSHVATNAAEGVSVQYGGADIDSATPRPNGWVQDDPTGDAISALSPVGSWYDYNFMTHQLSGRDDAYLVRATDGRTYRLRFDDYYNDLGVSGHVTMTWQQVPDRSRN